MEIIKKRNMIIHRVENVNEDEEESYKKCHSTRNNIGRNNEAYPGHDDK